MENKKELSREKTTKNLNLRERHAIQVLIADLILRGYNDVQIFDYIEEKSEIKISINTVRKYSKEIISTQNERREEMTDKAYTLAFMKVEGLERKGWEMLLKSQDDRTKSVTKTKTKGSGKTATTETEQLDEVMQSVGDIRILEFLRQCNRDRLEILRNGKFNAPEETTQAFIQQNNFYTYDVGYRAVPMEPIKTK